LRVAFYAPLKAPDHAVPSGDRRMARLLMAALELGGHTPELMSRLRSFDGTGDAGLQQEIERRGQEETARIVADIERRAPAARPRAWFTYHLHYKAPDWIGPAVCDALALPYIVAEASHAPKRAGGPWDHNHRAVERAIRRADAVLCLTRHDRECVAPLVADPARLHVLAPFIDAAPYAGGGGREAGRQALGITAGTPVLLAVAMMRPGDKLESYRVLGRALALVHDLDWRLAVAGDGPARPDVEAALAPISSRGADRVVYVGERTAADLPALYAAADVYVWPAIGEAYGMAFLEAQAAGLPVVAGNERGVPDVVADGRTGLLARPGDAADFADKLRVLLTDHDLRAHLAANAAEFVATERTVDRAASALAAVLDQVTTP
jgi:glycosyltransferase involved in cell wall biosynthesis